MFTLTTFRRNCLICLALVLATVAVYWPVWFAQFLSVDDGAYVTGNSIVQQGLTLHGIAWAFRAPHVANYHPITWLSHMLDCQLFGTESSWHHAMNLALHALNVVLVYLVLRSMTGRNRCSVIVAAIFALHPVHVESVAWIAERKDVLSGMFFLLTLAAWTWYARSSTGAPWKYITAFLLFALGLLSKPMLVTMPGVLLLVDLWPLGRTRWFAAESMLTDTDPPTRSIRFLLIEKIPFVLLAAGVSAATMLAQADYGAVATTDQVPIAMRFANAAVAYVRYVRNFLWPAHLSAFYPMLRPWPAMVILASIALLALITVASLMQAKRRPWLAMGWLWFLGTLVPVIGLVQVGSQAMADRYMYLPMIGLTIIVVWAAAEIAPVIARATQVVGSYPSNLLRHGPALALVAVTLMSFAAICAQEVRWWHDSEVLFTRAIEQTEPSVFPMHNVACALAKRGDYNGAVAWLEQCKKLQPGNPYVRQSLGYALNEAKRYSDAIKELTVSVRARPELARTWNTFGHVYRNQGKWKAAVDHFAIAADLDPEDYDSRLNLAIAHRQLGQLDSALADLKLAVRIEPYTAQPWFMYGELLLACDKPADALPILQHAVSIDPKSADGQLRLGIALMRTGRGEQAIPPLMASLQLDPNSPEALAKLAWLLATYPDAKLRRGSDAVALAERAIALAKSSPQFLSVLAAAQAEEKQFAQAAKTATDAAELAEAAGDSSLATKMQTAAAQYRGGEATRDPTLAGADAGDILP